MGGMVGHDAGIRFAVRRSHQFCVEKASTACKTWGSSTSCGSCCRGGSTTWLRIQSDRGCLSAAQASLELLWGLHEESALPRRTSKRRHEKIHRSIDVECSGGCPVSEQRCN